MTKCDDCEEEVKRRRKCSHCGLMVCPWCDHHVHALVREKAKRGNPLGGNPLGETKTLFELGRGVLEAKYGGVKVPT